MGMNLSGMGRYFRFSNYACRAALAHEHGWEPAGTEPPEVFAQKIGGPHKSKRHDPTGSRSPLPFEGQAYSIKFMMVMASPP